MIEVMKRLLGTFLPPGINIFYGTRGFRFQPKTAAAGISRERDPGG